VYSLCKERRIFIIFYFKYLAVGCLTMHSEFGILSVYPSLECGRFMVQISTRTPAGLTADFVILLRHSWKMSEYFLKLSYDRLFPHILVNCLKIILPINDMQFYLLTAAFNKL